MIKDLIKTEKEMNKMLNSKNKNSELFNKNYELFYDLQAHRNKVLYEILKTHEHKPILYVNEICVDKPDGIFLAGNELVAEASFWSVCIDPLLFYNFKYRHNKDSYKLIYSFHGTRANDAGMKLEITL